MARTKQTARRITNSDTSSSRDRTEGEADEFEGDVDILGISSEGVSSSGNESDSDGTRGGSSSDGDSRTQGEVGERITDVDAEAPTTDTSIGAEGSGNVGDASYDTVILDQDVSEGGTITARLNTGTSRRKKVLQKAHGADLLYG